MDDLLRKELYDVPNHLNYTYTYLLPITLKYLGSEDEFDLSTAIVDK